MPSDVTALARVELQAEVGLRRSALFDLVSTSAGLSCWLDEAAIKPVVGGAFRFRLAEAVAEGTVVAIDAPQHISLRWGWASEPGARSGVVAFDLVEHGSRTHLTLRHVGLAAGAPLELHDAVWRYWFGRLVEAGERHEGRGALPGPH